VGSASGSSSRYRSPSGSEASWCAFLPLATMLGTHRKPPSPAGGPADVSGQAAAAIERKGGGL
jgi:hypothetical protein